MDKITLATEIAKLGSYNSTDITNIVAEAIDLISFYYGSTYTETTSEDWDRIAKHLAVHLLDRLQLQRQSKSNPSISVPPLIPKHIEHMIDRMTQEVQESTVIVGGYTNDTDTYGNWWEEAS